MKHLLISLALGDIYSKGGTGPLNTPVDGAVARFKALTDTATCDEQTLVVCTAGFARGCPFYAKPIREISLAGQLRRYVAENSPQWLERLVVKPRCWSTRNEVRLGIKEAMRSGFANKEEPVMVFIASNMAHLPRISLYARMYLPKKWGVMLVRASHPFTLWSHIQEPIKIRRDLFYILRVRRRLRRLKLRQLAKKATAPR